MSGNRLLPRKGLRKKFHTSFSINLKSTTTKWNRNTKAISKEHLQNLYYEKKQSMQEIANTLGCSLHKVVYWMGKYKVKTRARSDAAYVKNNPSGDPFRIKTNLTKEEAILYGLGIGLYWGEGHKRSTSSIRLGNTDPFLIKAFMEFLVNICGVSKRDIDFHLMIFRDTNENRAKEFWTRQLKINKDQIKGKVTILSYGGKETYRHKSENGVIVLQYHNTKLQDIINKIIEEIKK